jgi:hypothetical protein
MPPPLLSDGATIASLALLSHALAHINKNLKERKD